MKRSCSILVLISMFIGFSQKPIFANGGSAIRFGDKQSGIRVKSGATFNVGSNNLVIQGTLSKEVGASITGNEFSFDEGTIKSGTLDAEMTGVFDPTDPDTIKLNGDSRLRAEPGQMIEALVVSDSDNRLEGQPLFSNPIVLTDAATELTIAMQSTLNKSIELNDGKVILENDLKLDDDVILHGDGQVDLNKRELQLGSVYSDPWSGDIHFIDALDIVLNGRINLSGDWKFSGLSCLNGNGCVLDLSDGGRVIVDKGSTLSVNDVHITGLGNSFGQILMLDKQSQIRTSNASFKLNDTITTTQGGMYVEGPTVFQLGDKDWNFNTRASMTVDGTTLWLDYLDTPSFPGQLSVDRPLFDGHVWNGPNLKHDIDSGYLTLVNSGTVKASIDWSIGGGSWSPAEIPLLTKCLTSSISMNQSVWVSPDLSIRICGNVEIDGRGAKISFANINTPQFLIREGQIVTLRNVTLTGITQNTFDFRRGARMLIGENVIFELEENVTFSSSPSIDFSGVNIPTIRVLDDGGCNVFTIRGLETRRRLELAPLVPLMPGGAPRTIIDLGHNTLLMENAEIFGMNHITYLRDGICSPAIALSGDSSADVDTDTNIDLFIEGINNDLVLRHDGLQLGGSILFGDFPDNQLAVHFIIADPINPNAPGRPADLPDRSPYLNMVGESGIYLSSNLGIAQLEFADYYSAINLAFSNSFATGPNALLMYKNLYVSTFPIKQSSIHLRQDGITLGGQGIDQSFARTRDINTALPKLVPNALQKRRQNDRDLFAFYQELEQGKKAGKVIAPKGCSCCRDIPVIDETDETRAIAKKKSYLRLPDPVTQAIETIDANSYKKMTVPVAGNYRVMAGATLDSLLLDPTKAANISLYGDNAKVVQSIDAATGVPVPLHFVNGVHVLNVNAKGTVLEVYGDVIIDDGVLFIAPDAELTILSVNKGATPRVIFGGSVLRGTNTGITLPQNSVLRLAGGPAETIFSDGVVINGEGLKVVDPITNASTVSRKPRFIVQDLNTLSVEADGQARIQGVIGVEVGSNGSVDLKNSGSVFVFGSDTSATNNVLAENAHDISLSVVNSGEFAVGNSSVASFRYGTWHIGFENSGVLFIEDGGRFEVNANGYTPCRGILKDLSFANGSLWVTGAGTFCLGSNKQNIFPGIATGDPYTFVYNGQGARFSGTPAGLGQSLGRDGSRKIVKGRSVIVAGEGYTARASFTDPMMLAYSENMTTVDLVRAIVQQNATLLVSTLYTDENGVQKIRTVKGIDVTLRTGDVILSDTPQGVISGRDVNGKTFTIDASGKRTP